MSVDTPAPDGALAELSVLFPDRDLTVADPDTGETVALTVRAFRFGEALGLSAEARPLIAALADAGDDDPRAIAASLAAHAEVWLALLASATGREAAWLARLSDMDGGRVEAAMWEANRVFFLRRVLTERTLAAARRSPGDTSSPTSPAPDSATTDI